MSAGPMATNTFVAQKEAIAQLHAQLEGVSIFPLDKNVEGEIRASDLRRGRFRMQDDTIRLATLVDVDGVWYWEQGIVTRGTSGRRAGANLAATVSGNPLTTVKFEKLGCNQVAAKLEEMDRNFTTSPGLRQYNGNALLPVAAPVKKGRILLFIHGTFSNNDNLFKEFQKTDEGMKFLADITKQTGEGGVNYDQVLTFDHYTVSRSPVLNALELARLMAGSTADIDIVCHSRGGLVTRWFLEVFDHVCRGRRRAVFVGSPLRGTSLAAPDRIRNGIHLFSNLGREIGAGLSLIPFAQVAGSLMQIVFSLSDGVSNTPLVDAAVAMIPGLAAMSRVQNNFELDSLKECAVDNPPEYSAVTSIFKTEDIGWKFWKVFCDFGPRAAEAGDNLIFRDAENHPCENDLVVDTLSMTEYGIPSAADIKRFDENEHVYHTIYFQKDITLKYIRQRLGIS